MPQTREAITQSLTEQLYWNAARRDDSRIIRRLYRKPVVDTVYGWKLIVLIDARTQISLAAKVVKLHAHDTLWLRASKSPPSSCSQKLPPETERL